MVMPMPCRSRLLSGDDGLSETSSSVGAILGGRGAPGASRSIGRDSSEDDGGDEWDPERRAALRADRAAVEAAWGAHVADNDVDSLRWKVVRSCCSTPLQLKCVLRRGARNKPLCTSSCISTVEFAGHSFA